MFFPFGGGRIHYSVAGEGDPVVLLHGYLETSEIWNGFARKLAEHFRVIAIDLPGHGKSDTFGSTHTMEFLASAVRELLAVLDTGQVFLTGHSLGGYVTLAFLDLYPESLSGYCLFHSQPFPDTPETIEKRMREIALVKEGNKGLFYPDNIKRMYARPRLEKFQGAVSRSMELAAGLSDEGITAMLNGMMQRPSRVAVMEEGRVPGLWILGAMDSYIPCETMPARVKLPGNSRVVILNESGHMGFIEEEDKALEVLVGFIGNKNWKLP
jgi:pimeloyl-ACP methyl ester carboxylesterase